MDKSWSVSDRLTLRLEVEEFYANYIACLDEERFEQWPEFFTDDCFYQIIPRLNFERGLPMATWRSEGRGYLLDRITAIRKTSVYGPRYMRRIVSAVRLIEQSAEGFDARANYAAFETLPDEFTRVFSVGQSHDAFTRIDGALKLRRRVCVFDSELVPNSLVYPL